MSYPFGNPDASRLWSNELESEFIDSKEATFPSISFDSYFARSVRVITGTKGSGKSRYLVKAYRSMTERHDSDSIDDNSVYLSAASLTNLPATDLIIRFSEDCNIYNIRSRWLSFWRCVVLKTITLHILYGEHKVANGKTKSLKSYVDPSNKKHLVSMTEIAKDFFRKDKLPLDMYQVATNFLDKYSKAEQFINFANKDDWNQLSFYIKQLLNDIPPMYFFVDSSDEEYAYAPYYWMYMQLGLFDVTMRYTRDIEFSRLHLVICIRDHIFMFVNEDEHLTRFIGDPAILQLRWDYSSMESFLTNKLKRIDKEYFVKLSNNKSIHDWLGMSTILNKKRNKIEPIEQYILRHTRMIPRDIVVLGNVIADEIQSQKVLSDNDVRRIVSIQAQAFGNELFNIIAAQLINNLIPAHAGKSGYSESYTVEDEYRVTNRELVKRIVRENIKSEVLTWEELEKIGKHIDETYGLPIKNSFFDVFWRNGAIGYLTVTENGDEEEFFIADLGYNLKTLPPNKAMYALRPCLYESAGRSEDFQYHERIIIGSNGITRKVE